ncbi:Uncharacterised protein [Enterobacter cloacae]|uniref:Uncharacterized protein n=1 Tax=Enterobacter cloacae TaxID=550 RepID=A0A377LQA1_ENTCL|nr:Uncharacterised protein [Enterobacter cloacae]
MSLWLTHPLFVPSAIVGGHHCVMGDVAIAGIHYRAAVLHGSG